MSIFFFSSRRRHTRSLRDWSSDVCSSDLLERTQRFGIARVFEPSRIAGVKKQPGGQIECLLGARSDDDLLSVATHSARSANVLCDRLAQWQESLRVSLTV